MTRSTRRLREPYGARNAAALFASRLERCAEQGGGPHGAERVDLLSQPVVLLAGEGRRMKGLAPFRLWASIGLSFRRPRRRSMTWLTLSTPWRRCVSCSVAVLSADVDHPLLAPGGATAVPRSRKGVLWNGQAAGGQPGANGDPAGGGWLRMTSAPGNARCCTFG